MPGTHVPGVLLVVVEVARLESAFFVSDEPIGGDLGRVKLHLDLHVLGDGHHRSGHLIQQHFAGFAERVEIGVITVAAVGHGHHPIVPQVADADSQDAQEHAGPGLFRDQRLQLVHRAGSDVEIAIRAQDHPVDLFLFEMQRRLFVREPDPACPVGGAARPQAVDGLENPLLLLARGAFQCHLAVPRVGHHRHPVLFPELSHQEPDALLDQRQTIRRAHAAGDVDEENKVGGAAFFPRDFPGFERHPGQPMEGLPRRLREVRLHGKRFAVRRHRVGVGKIVHQLLDPHRIRVRPPPLVEHTAHEGIGGGVHIARKRGHRFPGNLDKGVLRDRTEAVSRGGEFPGLEQQVRPGFLGFVRMAFQEIPPQLRPPGVQRLRLGPLSQKPRGLRQGVGCRAHGFSVLRHFSKTDGEIVGSRFGDARMARENFQAQGLARGVDGPLLPGGRRLGCRGRHWSGCGNRGVADGFIFLCRTVRLSFGCRVGSTLGLIGRPFVQPRCLRRDLKEPRDGETSRQRSGAQQSPMPPERRGTDRRREFLERGLDRFALLRRQGDGFLRAELALKQGAERFDLRRLLVQSRIRRQLRFESGGILRGEFVEGVCREFGVHKIKGEGMDSVEPSVSEALGRGDG